MTFASLYPLARVVTSRPPFSVVFTDWLSMTAVGLAARPWDCRRLERRASLALCQVLSLRQVRNVMEDNAPRWQVVGQHPPGATGAQHVANGVYDLAPGYLTGRPPGLGGGNSGSSSCHSLSSRSLG